MKSVFYKIFLSVLCLGAMSASAHRPIRVLIVQFVGTQGYQHTCIKTGIPYLINELRHPGVGADSDSVLAAVNISGYTPDAKAGQKWPITGLTPYDSGFKVDTIGNATNGAPIATVANGHELVAALPHYDVLFFNSTTAMGNLLSTTAERDSLLTWMSTHGTFCLHATSDTHQLWGAFDSVLGATFPQINGHTADYGDLLADTVVRAGAPWDTALGGQLDSLDPNFVQLRAGLPGNINASGTTAYSQNYSLRFYEEWFSYLLDPRNVGTEYGWATPRIVETLNEASLTTGPSPTTGSQTDAYQMNTAPGAHDHPLSWYRINSAGGRLWQQAAGHEDSSYEQSYYLRRIIYNAAVWLGGYPGGPTIDSITSPIFYNKGVYAGNNLSNIFLSGNSLTVTFLQPGLNSIEIRALDGRRLAFVKGQGQGSHTFTNLNHNTVYAILTSGSLGHQSRLITVQ